MAYLGQKIHIHLPSYRNNAWLPLIITDYYGCVVRSGAEAPHLYNISQNLSVVVITVLASKLESCLTMSINVCDEYFSRILEKPSFCTELIYDDCFQ